MNEPTQNVAVGINSNQEKPSVSPHLDVTPSGSMHSGSTSENSLQCLQVDNKSLKSQEDQKSFQESPKPEIKSNMQSSQVPMFPSEEPPPSNVAIKAGGHTRGLFEDSDEEIDRVSIATPRPNQPKTPQPDASGFFIGNKTQNQPSYASVFSDQPPLLEDSTPKKPVNLFTDDIEDEEIFVTQPIKSPPKVSLFDNRPPPDEEDFWADKIKKPSSLGEQREASIIKKPSVLPGGLMKDLEKTLAKKKVVSAGDEIDNRRIEPTTVKESEVKSLPKSKNSTIQEKSVIQQVPRPTASEKMIPAQKTLPQAKKPVVNLFEDSEEEENEIFGSSKIGKNESPQPPKSTTIRKYVTDLFDDVVEVKKEAPKKPTIKNLFESDGEDDSDLFGKPPQPSVSKKPEPSVSSPNPSSQLPKPKPPVIDLFNDSEFENFISKIEKNQSNNKKEESIKSEESAKKPKIKNLFDDDYDDENYFSKILNSKPKTTNIATDSQVKPTNISSGSLFEDVTTEHSSSVQSTAILGGKLKQNPSSNRSANESNTTEITVSNNKSSDKKIDDKAHITNNKENINISKVSASQNVSLSSGAEIEKDNKPEMGQIFSYLFGGGKSNENQSQSIAKSQENTSKVSTNNSFHTENIPRSDKNETLVKSEFENIESVSRDLPETANYEDGNNEKSGNLSKAATDSKIVVSDPLSSKVVSVDPLHSSALKNSINQEPPEKNSKISASSINPLESLPSNEPAVAPVEVRSQTTSVPQKSLTEDSFKSRLSKLKSHFNDSSDSSSNSDAENDHLWNLNPGSESKKKEGTSKSFASQINSFLGKSSSKEKEILPETSESLQDKLKEEEESKRREEILKDKLRVSVRDSFKSFNQKDPLDPESSIKSRLDKVPDLVESSTSPKKTDEKSDIFGSSPEGSSFLGSLKKSKPIKTSEKPKTNTISGLFDSPPENDDLFNPFKKSNIPKESAEKNSTSSISSFVESTVTESLNAKEIIHSDLKSPQPDAISAEISKSSSPSTESKPLPSDSSISKSKYYSVDNSSLFDSPPDDDFPSLPKLPTEKFSKFADSSEISQDTSLDIQTTLFDSPPEDDSSLTSPSHKDFLSSPASGGIHSALYLSSEPPPDFDDWDTEPQLNLDNDYDNNLNAKKSFDNNSNMYPNIPLFDDLPPDDDYDDLLQENVKRQESVGEKSSLLKKFGNLDIKVNALKPGAKMPRRSDEITTSEGAGRVVHNPLTKVVKGADGNNNQVILNNDISKTRVKGPTKRKPSIKKMRETVTSIDINDNVMEPIEEPEEEKPKPVIVPQKVVEEKTESPAPKEQEPVEPKPVTRSVVRPKMSSDNRYSFLGELNTKMKKTTKVVNLNEPNVATEPTSRQLRTRSMIVPSSTTATDTEIDKNLFNKIKLKNQIEEVTEEKTEVAPELQPAKQTEIEKPKITEKPLEKKPSEEKIFESLEKKEHEASAKPAVIEKPKVAEKSLEKKLSSENVLDASETKKIQKATIDFMKQEQNDSNATNSKNLDVFDKLDDVRDTLERLDSMKVKKTFDSVTKPTAISEKTSNLLFDDNEKSLFKEIKEKEKPVSALFSSDEDDMFSDSKKTPQSQSQPKPTKPLFGDTEDFGDENLFGTGLSRTQSIKLKPETKKENPKSSLFGDTDESDEDLFSGAKKLKGN